METTKNETNALILHLKEQNISEQTASILLESFGDFFKQASEWNEKAKLIVINDNSTPEDIAEASLARKTLKTIRVAVEHKRKELKEDSLRTGNTIDAVAKILKNLIEPTEELMFKAEKYFEEKENVLMEEKKAERISMLNSLNVDGSYFDLGNMPDDQWKQLLSNSTIAFDKKKEEEELAEKTRLEKETKEKEERQAQEKIDAEEKEKLRLENEELKKDKEAKENKEREKAEKIKAEKDERFALRENQLLELGAIHKSGTFFIPETWTCSWELVYNTEEKEWQEYLYFIKETIANKKEKDELAKQLKDKEAAEEKAKQEAEAKLQAELNQGDAEKLNDMVTDLQRIVIKYVFKSKKNQKFKTEVDQLIDKVINHIKK